MRDAALDEALTDEAPPLLAGRYRLEAMLGAGGMGTVYRVRDLELDDVVALKILQQLDPETVASFRDEVKLARRVTHRNVARTFDIGEFEGTRFLTMEYVEGETLARLLARGRLQAARAHELALQIAHGLGAIHAEGLAHGDLKPANVLVDLAGNAKLSDFGLARPSEPARAGLAPGTPEYMAPEQLTGSLADARTDVFALGIVLAELFTGVRPWVGSRTEVLTKKLVAEAPTLRETLPVGLRALVLRCLAFDPAARFADSQAVIAALEREGSPARSPSARPLAPATRPERGAVRIAVRALRADVAVDAYLGVALASDLGLLLASAPELEVLGAPLPAGDDTPEHAGRQVAADVVIEGTVRRSGESLRIALRLVSVEDGFLLWGRGLSTPLTGAVSELESAAAAIAAALSVKPALRRRTLGLKDPKLLELYMRARNSDGDHWHDAAADNSTLYADLLKHAPDEPFLLAAHANALASATNRTPDAIVLARELAERAVRLAPDLAEAQFAIGLLLFLANDLEGAARALVRALELSPSLPEAHAVLGQVLIEIGRVDEGVARSELALRLGPRLTMAWSNVTRVLAYGGDQQRVDALIGAAPQGRSLADEWLYWLTRARIAMYRGDEAAREVAGALAATPFAHVPTLATIARALTHEGTIEEAVAAVATLGGPHAAARARTMGCAILAETAMFLGQPAAALRAIAEAETHGLTDSDWLDRCPLLTSLATDDTFRTVRDRVAARGARVGDALVAAGLAPT